MWVLIILEIKIPFACHLPSNKTSLHFFQTYLEKQVCFPFSSFQFEIYSYYLSILVAMYMDYHRLLIVYADNATHRNHNSGYQDKVLDHAPATMKPYAACPSA